MAGEGREAPAEPVSAEPPAATEVVIAESVAQGISGASPLTIFLGISAVLLLSLGVAMVVLGLSGRVASTEPEATPTANLATAAPGRTAGAAAAAGVSRVRVTNASGRSRAVGTGAQYEVTFAWTLEGARQNDPVSIQFYVGTQSLGQQRGTLDPAVFNFSTGTLTVTATLDCSTGGWSAEILTIRGQTIEGDSEAKAPGVQCR